MSFSSADELPVVDGATALFPVYCSFVEAVYPKDCDVESCVHFSTTGGAYKSLIAGEADVIFVAQPSREQLASAKDAGLELALYPIGYEAFVFIVNKENIRNKSYPVTGNFYAISVKGRESENTRSLIEWVRGAQGQELIEKVGYVPL